MGDLPKPVLFLILCVSGIGPLWFIQLLWLFTLLLIPLRRLEKDRLYALTGRTGVPVLLLLTAAVYGAAQIFNVPVVLVYRFGLYGLGFFLGYFVFSHDEVMARLEKHWRLFSLLALGSGAVFAALNWGKPYPEHEVLDTLSCNVYVWWGTLGVLALMKKWGGFRTRFSVWMGKRAWGLYVFHYLPIAASTWYLTTHFPQLPAGLVYAAVGVSGFAGALLLEAVLSRIPLIRWCVLGIKKERKQA